MGFIWFSQQTEIMSLNITANLCSGDVYSGEYDLTQQSSGKPHSSSGESSAHSLTGFFGDHANCCNTTAQLSPLTEE